MNEPDIKRWTAKRKAALVKELLRGQTTVAEAARQHDLLPSEIEKWVEDAEAADVSPYLSSTKLWSPIPP